MKQECETCSAALLEDGEALICSFECTFCLACGAKTDQRCPNCNGELLRRPRRTLA